MYCLWLKTNIDSFAVIAKLEGEGLITNSFLFAENTIRITPPLTITTEELQKGLKLIVRVIEEVS